MGERSPRASHQESRDNPLGFFSLLREILWSFLGIRSKMGYEQTFARARPRDIILVGLFATLVFVLALVGMAYLAITMTTG